MPKRPEVERWLAAYDNPMKDVVLAIRDAVLAADKRVDECIKWQAPTFTFEGNIASFYPRSKKHASLMFHQGATIPGTHPRLEGTGGTSRVLKLGSVAEVRKAKKELQAVVKAWIAWKEGDAKGGKGAAKKKAAAMKGRAVKKKVGKRKAAKRKAAKKK